MAKEKDKKINKMVDKTLHRKLKIEQHEPHKKQYLGTNLIIITSLTYLPLPVCHGMVDL